MANIAQYGSKAMLDWVLLGATPTRPSSVNAGLSLGAPSSTSGSEVNPVGSGYARSVLGFNAAATPSGSAQCTNTAAVTFGPFSSAQSISGLQIWDTITATANAGNMLWYGNLAVARTVGVGDSLVIASGALTITLL